MTAMANEDGWIDWAGGECPVTPKTMVRVKFRYSGSAKGGPWRAGDFRWSVQNNPGDIIAYRVVTTALTNAERSRRHRTRRSAKLARIGELEGALRTIANVPREIFIDANFHSAWCRKIAKAALTPKENPDE